MNVTIEDAYREACTALGEAEVRSRLQAQEIQRLTALVAEVQQPASQNVEVAVTCDECGQTVLADSVEQHAAWHRKDDRTGALEEPQPFRRMFARRLTATRKRRG